MTRSDRDYVLGTHDEELRRLGLQHQLWRAQAIALWERAKFAPGHRLLDVGCGPGFGTADLSDLAGPTGHVTAIDVSEKYADRVRSRGLSNVDVHVCDVQQLAGAKLPTDHFDGAYCRWVLCFVPEPQRVIEGVARLLKPRARFAIQDYYNYTALKLAPNSEAFRRVIRAVDESWRAHGGDPDIGCRLPAMLEAAGLRVTHLQPILRVAKPDDSLWQWPTSFFRIFVPTLVQTGYLTEAERQAFERDWAQRSNDPHAFFTSPPMLDIIAQKI